MRSVFVLHKKCVGQFSGIESVERFVQLLGEVQKLRFCDARLCYQWSF
jgi:hypothetical protein